jgi:hypothetical protein
VLIDNIFNKKPIIFLLSVLSFLLIFSLFFEKEKDFTIEETVKINSYFNDLPSNYIEALITYNKKSKDTITNEFKLLYLEKSTKKELVIIKESPENFELFNDFLVEVYPVDKSRLNNDLFYTYNITGKAVIYKYKTNKIASFKFELPFFDVEKIVVKQVLKNKKSKFWTETLNFSPDKKVPYNNHEDYSIDEENYSIYLPLLISLLEKENIKHSYNFDNKSNTESINFIDIKEKTTLRVIDSKLFWKSINEKENTKAFVKIEGKEKDGVSILINNYLSGKINFESLFDINKLVEFYAIQSVFTNDCREEVISFVYDPNDNKLEPLFLKNKCIGLESKSIKRKEIKNLNFINKYVKALNEISKLNFEEILENDSQVLNQTKSINIIDHSQIFSYDYLKINQLKIAKNLNPSTIVKPELISIDNDKLILSIINASYYPIDIIGLNYKSKKEITNLSPFKRIMNGQQDTIQIDLTKSFQNLFVSKKSKKVGFKLHKHIYDLKIKYKILGLDQVHLSSIIPYQEREDVGEDLFRSKEAIKNHKDLLISGKEITFKKDSVVISSPLVIPKGYVFKLNSGTKINIIDGGKIISYAPLSFNGTKENPIEIFSSDRKGQGMIVFSEGEMSHLKHVIFDHLTNLEHGNWNVSGAVTFYESPVDLYGVRVSNNRCEDALNIIRTTFNMKNCTISNTQSDAFDGDFVTGTISDSEFNNLGNDAIDVSGSDLKIINVQISNAGDKGLSAGENSKMSVNNVSISKSEIAIAGKDLSVINAKNIKIGNTKLAITAFQKKPEFGPSNITVDKIQMNNVEMNYLIENTSSLIVDGVKVKASENVKDRMYGVEFGVSSKETRKSQ